NTNDLAALIVMAAPLLVFPRLIRREFGRPRIWDVFLILMMLLGLVLSQSRGAFIAVFASGLVYLLITAKSVKRMLTGLAAMAPLPMLMGVVMSMRHADDLQGSSESRFNYVIAGLKMVKDHPIFGVGVNNYPRFYEQYTPAFFEWGQRTAHNSWVLCMAETGIPGVILLMILFGMGLKAAWSIRAKRPEYLLSLISYGVAMSFLSHTYSFFPYVILFLVFGAARVHGGKKVAGAVAAVLLLLGVPGKTYAALEGSAGVDRPVGTYQPALSPKIQLAGSRGETVSFLMKATGEGCSPISLPAWAGGVHTKFYRVETIRTEHPSFPGAFVGEIADPLIPLTGERSLCVGP
ncbi:MAG TPA: O-antigen ligase family protein, partial [Bdellovibrionota bacterium]|nr:O-antigen ligase family protein [Bdellovibrionota bacterium]